MARFTRSGSTWNIEREIRLKRCASQPSIRSLRVVEQTGATALPLPLGPLRRGAICEFETAPLPRFQGGVVIMVRKERTHLLLAQPLCLEKAGNVGHSTLQLPLSRKWL